MGMCVQYFIKIFQHQTSGEIVLLVLILQAFLSFVLVWQLCFVYFCPQGRNFMDLPLSKLCGFEKVI